MTEEATLKIPESSLFFNVNAEKRLGEYVGDAVQQSPDITIRLVRDIMDGFQDAISERTKNAANHSRFPIRSEPNRTEALIGACICMMECMDTMEINQPNLHRSLYDYATQLEQRNDARQKDPLRIDSSGIRIFRENLSLGIKEFYTRSDQRARKMSSSEYSIVYALWHIFRPWTKW